MVKLIGNVLLSTLVIGAVTAFAQVTDVSEVVVVGKRLRYDAMPRPGYVELKPGINIDPSQLSTDPDQRDLEIEELVRAAEERERSFQNSSPDITSENGELVEAPTRSTSRSTASTPPVSGTKNSSASALQSQRESIISRYNASQCEDNLRKAKNCCEHPEQCLGSAMGATGGASSTMMVALQALAGGATQMASISGACGTMKTVATGMAAINGVLAFQCSNKIRQCKASCASIRDEAKSLLSKCSSSLANKAACAGMDPSTPAGEIVSAGREFNSELEDIVAKGDMCERLDNAAIAQTQQAIASAYTAKLMGLCKSAATSTTPTPVATNSFDVNCSDPANAANPACQNQCARANAQYDPACNPNLNQSPNIGDGNDLSLADASGSGSSIDEIEKAQDPLMSNIAATGSRANVGGGGGGAGLPGAGGDMGGGGDNAAGGTAQDPLNKDIMGGVRSGGGYSQPFMRSSASGGGFSGYGGNGRGVASEGKPFNPKDFLPGGKLDPKRKLAGLAPATADIGAVHGDIFKNITNRFYQVCLRDALFDCSTLRKSGKQGN